MGHWYTIDKKPMHTIVGTNGRVRDTNLADARKHNLLPSVSTILDLVGSKSLEDYKTRQAVFYARQCPAGTSDKDVFNFVRSSMDGYLDATAEVGSELHNDFENWCCGKESVDARTWGDIASKLRASEFVSNEVTLADLYLGYGGTCDMVFIDEEGWLVIGDLKTKKEPGRNGFFSSENHILQLGAYYQLILKDKRFESFVRGRQVKGAIAFVSRLNRNGGIRTNDVKFYSSHEIHKAARSFQHLVRFWQEKNDFTNGL